MELNYTPLDPSMMKTDTNNTVPPSLFPKKKVQFDTIYLIFSGALFVLSLGVMMSTSSIKSTTDAKTPPVESAVTPIAAIKYDFPETYKQESIPLTVYENLNSFSDIPVEGREEFVKTQVMKFYIYKDVLQENAESSAEALIPKTFQDIRDGVAAMEPVVKENLLSKAFFGYIKVRFAGSADEEALKGRFGDLEKKAGAVIKRYQQMFVTGEYTPNQIIDISNRDEELLTLNNREQNEFLDDYDSTRQIFNDPAFDDFLFEQQVNQLSDLFTLHSIDQKPHTYIIVYPTKLLKKKYISLEKLIEEKAVNFTF